MPALIAFILVPAATAPHLDSCSRLLILILVLPSRPFFRLQPEVGSKAMVQSISSFVKPFSGSPLTWFLLLTASLTSLLTEFLADL